MESTLPQIGQARRPALDWYLQAKFGLFIHWGAYAVAGAEASWPIMTPDLSEVMFGTQVRINEADYTALPGRFNPVDFDAEAWVRIAQGAGMRYMVFTAKHHDGFCMFDAPGTDYKITNTPFGRDVCLELAQACAKAGMPLGFYYSPPDMHHPGYRDTRKPARKNWLGEPRRKKWGSYLDYMESHLRKLLSDYGPVKILWFDGLTNHAKYDPRRFHRLIRSLSPDTLINDRLGDDYDFITPEQSFPGQGIPVRTGKPPAADGAGGDLLFRAVNLLYKIPGARGWIRKQIQKMNDGALTLTPVLQEPYPDAGRFQPWETCMTMGRSWGYNPHETDWKAPGKLVRNLVEVASRGGNYLLNVGPTERGAFPAQALERLAYVGRWLEKHGEAIYGSTYTPLQGLPWGRATRQADHLALRHEDHMATRQADHLALRHEDRMATRQADHLPTRHAKTFYLHVFDWPLSQRLNVPNIPFQARQVSLLNGEALAFTQTGQQLQISLPAQAPDPDVSVLVVDT